MERTRRRELIAAVGALGTTIAGCITLPEGWDQEPGSGQGTPRAPPQEPVDGPIDRPVENPPVDPPDDPGDPGIGPDDLAVYRSEQYGFSTLYPEPWNVDDGNPAMVVFAPGTGEGAQYTQTFTVGTAVTLDRFVETYVETRRSDGRVTSYRSLGDRATTIPSGQDGRVVDSEYTFDGTPFVERALLVVDGETLYSTEVLLVREAYTEQFDAVANLIAGSLVIQS